ncbi:uracil-DNA glycosylase [Wohlfahrtiimonas larvae]|uniref:Type-4 uracil-DNA glycosylase n=1 Tax=Wohlfahrtiimonas larvae TaxID=1157986 RepID=A0ABP9MY44_9GAMM|nr:uracil-DNA glycosylase [Wohlfahrtiimonas larvae]
MNHNLDYLKLLKIPVWQVRGQEVSEAVEPLIHKGVAPAIESIAASAIMPMMIDHPSEVQSASGIATDYQAQAIASLENCVACKLHNGRTQVIQGKGSKSAKIVVVTEAPTFNEDVAGEPFAEEAGKLFENILKSIGYHMEDVYITPYVKCAPYQSFITETEEAECYQHLMNELNEIQPQKVLLLGRNVAKYLLKTTQPFDTVRTQSAYLSILGKNIPVYVSYNPYQLMKFPEEKRKAWNDFKKLVK